MSNLSFYALRLAWGSDIHASGNAYKLDQNGHAQKKVFVTYTTESRRVMHRVENPLFAMVFRCSKVLVLQGF